MTIDETIKNGCIECGVSIPQELINKLLKGESIFCEMCGAEIDSDDYKVVKSKSGKSYPKTTEALKKAYTTIKSKSDKFKI